MSRVRMQTTGRSLTPILNNLDRVNPEIHPFGVIRSETISLGPYEFDPEFCFQGLAIWGETPKGNKTRIYRIPERNRRLRSVRQFTATGATTVRLVIKSTLEATKNRGASSQ